MTAVPRHDHGWRRWVLPLVAFPLGCVATWLVLLAVLSIPTDRPSVWFGIPLVVVAGSVFLVNRRSRRVAVALGLAGALTLAFFAWLFWT